MDIRNHRVRLARSLMSRVRRHLGRNALTWVPIRLVERFMPPYYGRISLADIKPGGYVSRQSCIDHPAVIFGRHCFIGDRVYIYRDAEGGAVTLGDCATLHWDTVIQTGQGGSVVIGAHTTVQSRCQFSAYKGSIIVGAHVQIAPNCAFYPYNHGLEPGALISDQPLQSSGDIVVEDDAWLGYGVIVLDGARIGKGAVVGAGSVVSRDVPDGGIAVGAPARTVRIRGDAVDKPRRVGGFDE